MHIARKELQAFSESPELTVLIGVKQLRTHGTPNWSKFLEATKQLVSKRKTQGKFLVELAKEIRSIVKNRGIGQAHFEIHRLILESGLIEPYVRSFTLSRRNVSPEAIPAIKLLFPAQGDVVLVVTAELQGRRILLH